MKHFTLLYATLKTYFVVFLYLKQMKQCWGQNSSNTSSRNQININKILNVPSITGSLVGHWIQGEAYPVLSVMHSIGMLSKIR